MPVTRGRKERHSLSQKRERLGYRDTISGRTTFDDGSSFTELGSRDRYESERDQAHRDQRKDRISRAKSALTGMLLDAIMDPESKMDIRDIIRRRNRIN